MSDGAQVSTRTSLQEWIARLGEPAGDPGGGAAAGVGLAMGGGLLSMVAGYVNGPQAEEAAIRGRRLREEALRLADADAEASEGFSTAFGLPEGPERDEAVRRASLTAAASAAELGRLAARGVADLELLVEIGSPMLVADVVAAGAMMRAALVTARANVGGDLGVLSRLGDVPEREHPQLWSVLDELAAAVARIDALMAHLEPRLNPEAHR